MRAIIVATSLLLASSSLAAQVDCDPKSIPVNAGALTVPKGFDAAGTTVALVVASSQAAENITLPQPAGKLWNVGAADVQAMSGVGGTLPELDVLLWTNGNSKCLQHYTLGNEVEQVPVVREYGMSDCQAYGSDWAREVDKQVKARKGSGFTMIVFFEDQGPCFLNRDYGVQGDPIYVGVYTKSASSWKPATFEPCAAEPETPSLFLSSGGGALSGLQSGGVTTVKFPPRRCWNASVDVSVVKNTEGAQPVRFPLSQSGRYRGTLQLGVLFTRLHEVEFGLRTTDSARVFSKGPVDNGPDYVATVLIYGLPRYLGTLAGGNHHYSGRDILHDESIIDRIGGIVGVGLRNPGKRFVAGLSFEALYGVNAIVVIDWARLNRLTSGVSVGSAFVGPASDIPTRDVWRHKVEVGVSLDLRYVTALMSHQ